MDRWVSVIGIAMALVLVMSSRGFQRIPVRRAGWMALMWLALFVIAALAFGGVHRS